jgi:lipid II:glycine glycyltransferase (peptidoglycan interpeptide bridge formation enzyme)
MIELANADKFIEMFEAYGKKVARVPLTYFSGRKVNLLMSKCGRRWICLPYLSEGVMETNPQNTGKYPFALFESEESNIYATRNVHWEIRDTKAYSNYIYCDKRNFKIDISDHSLALLDLYSPNVRRKIKKAIASGITVKQGGKELLNHFYRVYSRRMFQLGTCPCGRRFIQKRLSSGNYKLFVEYLNGKPIGAASLARNHPQIMENEFFSTQREYHQLYTSYILHFAMMGFARDANMSSYLLGRSTLGSSVYDYKKHFKAEEIRLFWSYSHKTKNIRNLKFLFKIWKAIPNPIIRILSGSIYRRIY